MNLTEKEPVALINPRPDIWKPNTAEPLSVLTLGAVLEREGIKVQVIDGSVTDITSEVLGGYKIFGVTAKTPQYPEALRILRLLEENAAKTGTKIQSIIGGPHATIFREQLLADGWTTVCAGEGELVIGQIVKEGLFGLVDGKRVQNLDSLPFPSRHLIHPSDYVRDGNNQPSITILSMRGCPYACIYCAKEVMGRQVRYRSVDNIVREIQEVRDRYGVDRVVFYDDTFTLRKDRTIALSAALAKLGVTWICNARVDSVDLETLKAMKAGGCEAISFGLESANERVLRSIDKRITTKQASDAIALTKSAGIKSRVYFMFGLPEDNWDSVYANLDFLRKVQPDAAQLSLAVPLPGTELARQIIAMGMDLPADLRQFSYAGLKGPQTFITRTKYLDEMQFSEAVKILEQGFAEWATQAKDGAFHITNVAVAK